MERVDLRGYPRLASCASFSAETGARPFLKWKMKIVCDLLCFYRIILNNKWVSAIDIGNSSVFTDDSASSLPEFGLGSHPPMNNIHIHVPDIIKLLKNLNQYVGSIMAHGISPF